MIGLTVQQAKQGFFDRVKVQNAVEKGTRRALSKFGAFVRQRAKTSIRKKKDVSAPGSPPHSHEGSLRKLIFFSWDFGSRSVVIGPTLLNTSDGSAPRLLEHGGTVTRKFRGKSRRLHYRPRPFMQPAFREELRGLPKLLRGSVR